MELELPIIDFSCTDRLANARKLTQAMETVGFVYLDNVPGFDSGVQGQLHDAAKWFFSLPLEDKIALSPKSFNESAAGIYRGYVPINVSRGHLREQYEMGEDLPVDDPCKMSGNPLYEQTPWPPAGSRPEAASFRELMLKHHSAMSNTGMEFLRLTAIGLGLDEHTFDDRFLPKSISSQRVMHYPAYENDKRVFTCEEHTDSVFVTLLVAFAYPGLEIQREDGTWTGVPPRSGSLIVNIGELLSRMTNRRFKATRHRVRDIGRDRFSVPFFFEPRSDAKFEFPDDNSKITYGPWVVHRVKTCYKYQYQFGNVELDI